MMRSRALVVCAGLVVSTLAPQLQCGSIAADDPAGVQVWNNAPWTTVSAGSYAGVNPKMKELSPISMLGVRNGACSGFVVVSSGKPITGLKATAGDLVQTGGSGKIAAGDILVRYSCLATRETSWAPAFRFDRLLEKAPAEVPVVDPAKLGRTTPKDLPSAAVQPVWITVKVPRDAVAGDYEGVLNIEAEGLAPACKVPVKVKVYDWVMPPLAERRVRTLGWMSPEQLAKYYNVPLWSDKHFELMGRSMALMGDINSRQVQINIVRNYPAQDNSDTMIKWIKQPDVADDASKTGTTYKYDFTVFDKYCDLVEKTIGKPFPLRLNIWRGPTGSEGASRGTDTFPQPKVLVLDPATGKVTELEPPNQLGSEAFIAFWKPFLGEVRARLEKRKWFDVTGLNWIQYSGAPPKKMITVMRTIWPDGKWSDVDHSKRCYFSGEEKGGEMSVFVQSTVWEEGTFNSYLQWKGGPYPREYVRGALAWQDKYKFTPYSAFTAHARNAFKEDFSLWRHRTMHEEMILKGNDGLGVVGADMFPVKDSNGRYNPDAWGAYAQGPSFGTKTILGAGPEAPVGTERLEAMRDGVQLCEAMIFIHKAQLEKKITGELADRANKVLDDRAKSFISHYIQANGKDIKWSYLNESAYAKDAMERDGVLYAMAAEVAKAMEKK